MLTYLLEVTVCWILLYGIFYTCMRRETFFRINRWYLLSALLLGLLIPLLRFIPIMEEVELYNRQVAEYMPIVYVIKDAPTIVANSITEQSIQWGQVFQISLWTLYALGVVFFSLRFIKGLVSIRRLYISGERSAKKNHTIIKTAGDHLPFSFLQMIFVSQTLPLNEDYNRILNHELEHVRARHSIDVILLELINIIFWFHPMIYLYKSALRQTHEYLADAAVCGNDSRQLYGQLLLRQSLSGLEIALAHHFFHSHIKKRINMIYQEKSGRKAWLKYALAVPALAVLMLVFTSQTTKKEEVSHLQNDEYQIDHTHSENDKLLSDNQQERLPRDEDESLYRQELEKSFARTLSKLPEKKIKKAVRQILKKRISDEIKISELETLYDTWLTKYPKQGTRIKDVMHWVGAMKKQKTGFSEDGKILLNTKRVAFTESGKILLFSPSYYLPGSSGGLDKAYDIVMSDIILPTYEELKIELERPYETSEIGFLHQYLELQGYFYNDKTTCAKATKLFKRYAKENGIDLGFDLGELNIQYNVSAPKELRSLISQNATPEFWGQGPPAKTFGDNFDLSDPIGMFVYLPPGQATKIFGERGNHGFVGMSHYTLGAKHPFRIKAALDQDIRNFFSTIDQLPPSSWINKLKKVHTDLRIKYGDDFHAITPFSKIGHEHNITLVFKEGKIIKAYRGDGNSTDRIDSDTKSPILKNKKIPSPPENKSNNNKAVEPRSSNNSNQNISSPYIKSIYENFKVPEDLRSKGIEGVVVVEFNINKDKRVTNYNVSHSLNEQLSTAAKKAIEASAVIEIIQESSQIKPSQTYALAFTVDHDDITNPSSDSLISIARKDETIKILDEFKIMYEYDSSIGYGGKIRSNSKSAMDKKTTINQSHFDTIITYNPETMEETIEIKPADINEDHSFPKDTLRIKRYNPKNAIMTYMDIVGSDTIYSTETHEEFLDKLTDFEKLESRITWDIISFRNNMKTKYPYSNNDKVISIETQRGGEEIRILYNSPLREDINFHLFDIRQKLIESKSVKHSYPSTVVTFDTAKLEDKIYFIGTNQGGRISSTKIKM